MVQRQGLFWCMVFVTVVFAGCVGGSATGNTTAVPNAPMSDENTGSITGKIVDESLLPIPNAFVSLLNENGSGVYETITSDASGRFTFHYVPAGKYQVEVKANGFGPGLTQVEVAAGEVPAEMTFRLVQAFADVAFYVTDHLTRMVGGGTVKWSFECSMTPLQPYAPNSVQSYVGKYCVGGNFCANPECVEELGGGQTPTSSGCQGSHSKDATTKNEYGGDGYLGGYRDLLMNNSGWQTQLAEVMWTPSSAVSGRGVLYEVLGPNVTNSGGDHNNRCGGINQSDPRDFLALSDQPPLRIEINHDLMTARKIAPEDHCCDWRWRLFPGWCDLGNCARWGPDANVVGVIAPTKVDVYYTVFFKQPPPPGWSIIDDR